MKRLTYRVVAHSLFLIATVVPAQADSFTDPASWAAYDPGVNGVGIDPDGYAGAVFDGRYVYFVPFYNGAAWHGEVLRYDSAEPFEDISSWVTYDPGANGVGTDPDGYVWAAFDGRYIYFCPWYNGNDWHAEVLRYDSLADFSDAASWEAYDARANNPPAAKGGYSGVVFDGRYAYFVPFRNGGTTFHGEVLRYDTSEPFSESSSWATYDAGDNGVGNNPDGYQGAVFDGRYVYMVPFQNGSGYHGEVLRLDTTGAFAEVASWAAYDPGANGVGTDPDGYAGAAFDGRYVYFVPFLNDGGEPHGEVLRYDTQGAFESVSSWTTYDPGENGLGTDPDGYRGAVFDGGYVYFVPGHNGIDEHGEVLRYDAGAPFPAVSSWATYDAGANGVGTDPDGYHNAAFDGRYIYLAPHNNGTEYHGEVLRYDTLADQPIPAVSEWGMVVMTLLVLTAGTLVCARRHAACV